MDTISACKAAVAWFKGRVAVATKQHSLRCAVDAAALEYQASFQENHSRSKTRRK